MCRRIVRSVSSPSSRIHGDAPQCEPIANASMPSRCEVSDILSLKMRPHTALNTIR